MRERTAGKAVKTADPDARGTDGERDVNNPPDLGSRVAAALRARSRVARFLLSGSPAFTTLMLGSSISMLGTRISTVAFPMLVLHLYNSPFVTGLVACAAIAPSMLAYMPAGALVDRWNPRHVMITSELLRGLAITSIVISLAVFGRHTSIWFLMLAMVVEEILEIFSYLADRRYLSRLMEHDNLTSKQAYVEVRAHAVVLAGRPVGPFLFAMQQFLPFLFDAISFLFSFGSLILVGRRGDEPAQKSPPLSLSQFFRDIGHGFNWLREDRRASLTVVLMAVTSMVAQALILMFLAEAHSKGFPTAAIGVVLAASGVGGAVGAISFKFLSKLMSKIVPNWSNGLWLPIQMVAWSVMFEFLARVGDLSVAWSAIAMFILGFTGAIGNIDFGTYLIAHAGDERIARVTSIGQMLAIGFSALGPVLGGAAIQYYGVHRAVQILLAIVLVMALFSFLTPAVTRPVIKFFHSIPRNYWHSKSASAARRIDRWPVVGDEVTAREDGMASFESGDFARPVNSRP